ncbi:DUF962 domain-containing protein [Mucilaginibacter aquaedulcis]|uniref:Mpo1 family 2-hydroxy fatty acid dioxygenase n=1 Tax=Mucilaginibacter aquaedulcis TaxID=1187081 RepID=UPI0025B4B42C|nr:Mpo1-like protein [Mucilaginibacter aquaedulcis]MDN3549789.1 DUF962 domain-containing protein [Mucilaginibacter aquaedulcis]
MSSGKISNSAQGKASSKTNGDDGKRKVDIYFAKYAESHQNSSNEAIHFICIPLIIFSLMGLIWSIPFPYLKFLGSYNGVFNWASFLIAFSIYYYLKLSPILSYIMLLVLFGFSYAIIELEQWHKAGGPALWLVCFIIFVFAWIGQFIGHKIEGKKPSFLDDLKFLLIGPIYLLHLILKKLKIKY